jgi:hypothetical protein
MLKQILDGFSYNPNLLYLPCRFWPNALAQLDPLRRAKNYRPRWIVVPESGEAIDAYDTFFFQFQVPEGCILWGYNFNSAGVARLDRPPANFNLKLTDSCTGVQLFQDYANGGGLSAGVGGGSANSNTKCVPILLSQPRVIIGSGKIDAAIENSSTAAATCQWLLHFAEPCAMIDERTGLPIGGR